MLEALRYDLVPSAPQLKEIAGASGDSEWWSLALSPLGALASMGFAVVLQPTSVTVGLSGVVFAALA